MVNTEADLHMAKTAATHSSGADWMLASAYGKVIHCDIGVIMLFTGRLDCELQALLVFQCLETGEFPACVTRRSWVDG